MFAIPNAVMNQYDAVLNACAVPPSQRSDYKKWLRFFYDFCAKYSITDTRSEQVRLFSEKLREKKQTEVQCDTAAHAVSLYFEMQKQEKNMQKTVNLAARQQNTPVSEVSTQHALYQRKSQYSAAGYQEKSDSQEWDDVLAKLVGEIKVRHYSRNTLKTYALWSRQFQRFLKNKPPQELSPVDVKEYLTFLAVKCKVAASTQNQAFFIG